MRLRLLVLVAGLGAAMSGAPVLARVEPPTPGDDAPVAARSQPALALLQRAVRAARTQEWSGTQQVVTVRDGDVHRMLLRVRHVPGTGSDVQALVPSAAAARTPATVADVLDEALLGLLAARYDLRVTGTTRCAGHAARLVEARHPGRAGRVAARFWVDTASGLVLRRDVLDSSGTATRSTSFLDLRVQPAGRLVTAALPTPTTNPVQPAGQRLDEQALDALADRGWPVPRALPAGLALFEARLHESAGDVLQLSYSDGLSTLSLFVQQGALPGAHPDAVRREAGVPERVVWSGGGRTWTLVSDAPSEVVEATVAALPHGVAQPADDGLLPRTWRGMSRVGAWLNPFD